MLQSHKKGPLDFQVCESHIFWMKKTTLRAANLLGAAVLGLHDEIKKTVEERTGHSGETSAAVTALGHQPGLSNDGLSSLLDLTHTGTVRLVDRLVADGLVEKRQSALDKRSVALFLTARGKSVRRQILADREAALAPLVSNLSDADQKSLANLLSMLLNAVAQDDVHKLRICRLCDAVACGDCPIRVEVGE